MDFRNFSMGKEVFLREKILNFINYLAACLRGIENLKVGHTKSQVLANRPPKSKNHNTLRIKHN